MPYYKQRPTAMSRNPASPWTRHYLMRGYRITRPTCRPQARRRNSAAPGRWLWRLVGLAIAAWIAVEVIVRWA